jgi:integrase/recombinase XerD
MLKIVKRHGRSCKARDKNYRKCGCSYHAVGMLNGEFIRKTLDTPNYEVAVRKVREWEEAGIVQQKQEPITIQDAVSQFLVDIKARNWQDSTRRRFDTLLVERRTPGHGKLAKDNPALLQFAQDKGYQYMRQLNLEALTAWRATWKDSPLSAQKNLERVRMFLRFCMEREWVANNPATLLKVRVRQEEKEPFTKDEMARILESASRMPDDRWGNVEVNAKDMLAMVLVLRHSGLRISDAVSLEKRQLVSRERGTALSVWQKKASRNVYIPIPNEVVEALNALASRSDRYCFWTGNGGLDTAITNWRARLYKLFKLAGIEGGHPHRFRHTFAAEMLLGGMDIRDVSILLGHKSVAITERHYAKFNKAQQAKLEDEVEKVWARQAEERRKKFKLLKKG